MCVSVFVLFVFLVLLLVCFVMGCLCRFGVLVLCVGLLSLLVCFMCRAVLFLVFDVFVMCCCCLGFARDMCLV